MRRLVRFPLLASTTALLAALALPRCDCGGGEGVVDKAYCSGLGLEYREKDGKGYCYQKGETVLVDVDCSNADADTPCDDSDACTFGDHCDPGTGTCTGTPLTGYGDGNPCTEDLCDPVTGAISFPSAALDGQGCDDGDPCSSGDTCQAGICAGTYTVDRNGDPIDDNDACTRDSCDATGLRQNVPFTAAEAAAAGLGGITVEQTGNPCLQYQCAVGTGATPTMVALPDGTICANPAQGRGNGPCVSWACLAGQCVATVDEQAVSSAQPTGGQTLHPDCRMRECDTRTGQVVFVPDPRTVDQACDDGNSCSFDDACALDGTCSGRELAHGTSCDDGNPCTVGDYCHIYDCRGGTDHLALANQLPLDGNPDGLNHLRDPAGILQDGNPCAAYACDAARGVVVSHATDGTTCDDNNPCTASSACQGGLCVGERNALNDSVPCPNPQNECEQGVCDKGVCINYQPVTTGQACTGNDPCRRFHCTDVAGQGVCTPYENVPDNPPVVCSNIGECIVGYCVGGTCTSQLNAMDGRACTGPGLDLRCNAPTCNTGACVANPVAINTPCNLTLDDLTAAGLSVADMACNQGTCQGAVRTCTPTPVNADGPCNNNNACDGVDWCQTLGPYGRCLERYTSDDPTAPAPPDATCTSNPGLCFDNVVPLGSGAQPCELDGDPSTVGRCRYTGDCVEISQVVDDQNDCSTPEWNAVTGAVELVPRPDGVPCHVVEINPCVENRGVCVDGTCHTNPIPDGTSCDLADQAIPAVDALPAGHRQECYAEVCVAGQCVVDTALRNGVDCEDSETTCTERGTCRDGACTERTTARGYGESCAPSSAVGIVDRRGSAIAPKDVPCWVAFECSESGTCNVAMAKAPDQTACDFTQDGDSCDGWCEDGVCVTHAWNDTNLAANATCDDDNPCTRDTCNGAGECGNAPVVDGPLIGQCWGTDPTNACRNLECRSGACIGIDNNNNFCTDDNPCTLVDRCLGGVCQGTNPAPAGTLCGSDDSDTDCSRQVCDSNGLCAGTDTEPNGAPCNIDDTCSRWFCQQGNCVHQGQAMQRPDGTNCDTNGVPCDEACLDLDGPLGVGVSECRPFSGFIGLLTAKTMAANGTPGDDTGPEELVCRALLDPTFDPTRSDPENSGHSCARYLCYYGACHAWDAELPAGLRDVNPNAYGDTPSLPPNPSNGRSCGESGPCTAQGVCQNNVCVSYHLVNDGLLCSEPRCVDGSDAIYQATCEAGACTAREALVDTCSKGVATCQGNLCHGENCDLLCVTNTFDWVNVFEDISSTGTPRAAQLRSPLDANQTCGSFLGVGAATEQQRMACDDGSILLDLQGDLGFGNPAGDGHGFWVYNRRYRFISISANGTVLLHKDHPADLSKNEETLFVAGNLGGTPFDPDALDQPGDPVNNGEGAAQIRVFRDDLTLITDIDAANIPIDPRVSYGDFTRLGEIYTRHMAGADGTLGSGDDYLIVQWHDVAFYGCAESAGARSHMTFQLKWWPVSGMMAFVFPPSRNDDGPSGGDCVVGRVFGSDASLGLVDEGGLPIDEVGQNELLLVNDSGPGTDVFDAYYLFWPANVPTSRYGWRTHQWFDDITTYAPARGRSIGQRLEQVSDCDTCCERVDLDAPLLVDGQLRDFLYVCVDGYVHFTDADDPAFRAQSLDGAGYSLLQGSVPTFVVAPFWGSFYNDLSPRAQVHVLDTLVDGQRQVIVQWTRAEYRPRTGLVGAGLRLTDQERGEVLCSDNLEDDGDGAIDCDDTSCACAAACGGPGCGLTFQVVFHHGLGMVEFRYLDDRRVLQHAVASASEINIGIKPARGTLGIELLDGNNGGGPLPWGGTLDLADVDEVRPSQQRSVLLPQQGHLMPYRRD